MSKPSFDLSLYLVLDPEMCGGERGMLRVAAEAVAGGVTIVQLRAPLWHKKHCYEAAVALRQLCRAHGVPLIINDHVDVALAADADGVHVGQRDLPAAVVRRLAGDGKIVGLSVSDMQEWRMVDPTVVDYLGIGPVWATATKPDASPALGIEGSRVLLAQPGKRLPMVAIGGITAGNAAAVMQTGVEGIAVVSAICASPEPRQAAQRLLAIVRNPQPAASQAVK